MKCSASVTFEFGVKQPLTHKIALIEAGSPHTVAARALREARKVLKPSNWASLVVVLERLDEDGSRKRLDRAESASSASEVPETV